MIEMINFKAHFIKSTIIEKKEHDEKFIPSCCNFVEINPKDSNDLAALKNIAKFWDYNSFTENIAYTGNLIANGRDAKNKYRIYALTTQNKNLAELDDEKILGIVETEKNSKNQIFLNYIQVRPEIIYSASTKIKRCGTAMLDCLKEIYQDKTISLNSKVHEFFLKNGFKLIDTKKNRFTWNKELASVIK